MARRLALNITDDYFTCSICCTLFEDPRQTPCEHTFCLKCLKDYGSRCRGKEFVCPICRTVTKIDDHTSVSQWILKLPVDTFLLLIMKTVNSYQNLNPNVSENLNPNVSESFDEPEATADTQVCSLHKERQLSIYCNDHSKKLCFECAWQKHTSCECISIKEESLVQKCEKTKVVVTKNMENVQKLLEIILTAETNYNEEKKLALSNLEEIQRRLQVFWGKIQMSLQENLQEILSTSKDFNNSRTFVENIKGNLNKLVLQLNSLDKMSVEEKLSILNNIDKEIEQVNDILSILEDKSINCKIDFSVNSELMNLLVKLDTVGTLRITKSCHVYNDNQESCADTNNGIQETLDTYSCSNDLKGYAEMTNQDTALPVGLRTNSSGGYGTAISGVRVTDKCTGNTSVTDNTLPKVAYSTNSPLFHYVSPDSVDYLHDIDLSADGTTRFYTSDQPQALQPLPDTQLDRAFGQCSDEDETDTLTNSWFKVSLDTPEQLQSKQTIIHETIITRKKNEKSETATLSGICIAENHVIVVDQYNNCIMRFDINSKELRGEIIVHDPHKVSLIPRTCDVLLTCWDQSKIYIISTESNFQIHDAIQTERNYIGVCAVDQNRILATATDRAIDLISFKGHVLITIRPIQSGVLQNLVYGQNVLLPADIGLLSDDNIIVHDGMKKSILCFSLGGKVKWQRKIKGISAIRCYRNAIYVSIGTENIVMKINDKGKVLDSNVLSNFTIRRPWAINISGDTIVVSEDSPSSKVHFFTFNM
ncbi:hypothetical protein KUTeg_014497 [Tegillarca granosa]|uniref:Uncharacterized protein n=1 Tax=Tegillarca granosa TaxID=220873 RepID=A0ABQ9EXF5_TEGGR|nr:hypothetical protein KUTeg_014497 [Tegillarca granosa]